MIGLYSLAAVVFIVTMLAWGWFRRWHMLLTLIVPMAGVFILGLATGGGGVSMVRSEVLQDLAWRPEYLSLGAWSHWGTAFTTMFLHADVAHLLVNVVIFAFMGLGFEDRVGRGRFLAVFVISGVFGTLLHSFANLAPGEAHVPVVGASGAVFGIIGAYATLFPRDRVILFFFLILPNVPVYIAAAVYTAVELFALATVGAGGTVARYAHVGGLVIGVLVALALMRFTTIERGDRSAPKKVAVEGLASLVTTDEQRVLYDRLLENRDEPEVARAWLERLARAIPCPKCGEPLEAGAGALKSACGHRVRLDAPQD